MRLAVLILLVIKKTVLQELTKTPLIKKPKDEIFGKTKYTQCSTKLEDDLPIVNATSSHEIKGSIFFIEPSCVGDLNTRQACSVESAALAHPKKNITILFVGPVPNWKLQKEPLHSLLLFENIKMFRLNVDDFVKGSPLEPIFKERLNQSNYPVEYLSQSLRFLTLYKYGGIYLDFDVLVLKPFTSLPVRSNWVAVEDEWTHRIGSTQMAISKSPIGKQFMSHIFRLFLSYKFDAYSWNDYCSTIMKAALKLLCGSAMFEPNNRLSNTDCYGLAVYEQSYFYKFNFLTPFAIFDTRFDLNFFKESYVANTYNSITFKKPINLKSGYATLMHRYCRNTKNGVKVIKIIKRTKIKAQSKAKHGTKGVKNQKIQSNSEKAPQSVSDIPTRISLKSDILDPFNSKNRSSLSNASINQKLETETTLEIVESKTLSLSSDLDIVTSTPGVTRSSISSTTPFNKTISELKVAQFSFDEDYNLDVSDSPARADTIKRQRMIPKYLETMGTPSARYRGKKTAPSARYLNTLSAGYLDTTKTPYPTNQSLELDANFYIFYDQKDDTKNITSNVTVPEQSLSTIKHKTHESTVDTFYKYNNDVEKFPRTSQNGTYISENLINNNEAVFRTLNKYDGLDELNLSTQELSTKTKPSVDEDIRHEHEYKMFKQHINDRVKGTAPKELHLPYLRVDWRQIRVTPPMATVTEEDEHFVCISEICT